MVHSLWASMPLGGFMLPFFDNDAISSASIPGDFVICFSVVQVEMLPSDHYDTTTCQVDLRHKEIMKVLNFRDVLVCAISNGHQGIHF